MEHFWPENLIDYNVTSPKDYPPATSESHSESVGPDGGSGRGTDRGRAWRELEDFPRDLA